MRTIYQLAKRVPNYDKVLFKSKITTKQTKGIESYPQNHIC